MRTSRERLNGLGVLLTALVLCASCSGTGEEVQETPPVEVISQAGLQQKIANAEEQVVFVHAWATWCPPCREEFPELAGVYKTFHGKGVRFLFVSMDRPSAKERVAGFMKKYGIPAESYIVENANDAFIRSLHPQWQGGIPASFFFNAGGELQTWWRGARQFADYKRVMDSMLEPEATGQQKK